MPVIAVKLSASTFAEVMAFVERGDYSSPEQFLEIATYNQIALERGTKPEDVRVQGNGRGHPARDEVETESEQGKKVEESCAPTTDEHPPDGPEEGGRPASQVRASSAARMTSGTSVRRGKRVPQAEIEETQRHLALAGCQAVGPAPARATRRPLDERVWGQVNRLFPLKLACRWLAVANAKKRKWETYEAIHDGLALDASTLGSVLERFDQASNRMRDDLLATGLPRRGNIASQDRFISQYVARKARDLDLTPGAICQYALATFDGDRLALTDRGLELARLENPLLDVPLGSATSPLSNDERRFFLKQVQDYVPNEQKGFELILGAINGGAETPANLLTAVRTALPIDWSEMMVRTHVSGLVARMADVSVLRRRWEGRNVTYETMV